MLVVAADLPDRDQVGVGLQRHEDGVGDLHEVGELHQLAGGVAVAGPGQVREQGLRVIPAEVVGGRVVEEDDDLALLKELVGEASLLAGSNDPDLTHG